MDADQDGVGLLAQWVAGEESFRHAPGAVEVARVESLHGDGGEGVLVVIGEALPLGREALVAEPFSQIAAVQRHRLFRSAHRIVEARLERDEVE